MACEEPGLIAAFDNLVDHLRGCIGADSLGKQRSDGSAAPCVRVPSWAWTCLQLLRLLQQYPAGVTAAVMETHLLSLWQSQVRRFTA